MERTLSLTYRHVRLSEVVDMSIEPKTRQRLLSLIRASKGLALRELVFLTGISRAGIRRHVTALQREGLIESEVVRRSVGRPSCVYSCAPTLRQGVYATFLLELQARKRRQAQADVEGRYREIAREIAILHPEIRLLPDPLQRLDAARRVLFGDVDSTPAVMADGECEFSHHTCPLATVALEFGDPCTLARAVLSELVGAEVTQSEWIMRGDPRCTFQLNASPESQIEPRPDAAGVSSGVR